MPACKDAPRWLLWILATAFALGVAVVGGIWGTMAARAGESRAADAKHDEQLAEHETKIQLIEKDIDYQTDALKRLEAHFETAPK